MKLSVVILLLTCCCCAQPGLTSASGSGGESDGPAFAPLSHVEQSVKLLRDLTLTIVRAHSTRSKTPSRTRPQKAPDLYVYVTATAGNKTESGDPLVEFFFAKSRVVKNSYRPVFNESFHYERDYRAPFTLGSDNGLRIHLYDQAIGWGEDESLGSFLMDLGQEILDREQQSLITGPLEKSGIIDYHGYHSVITYKIDFTIDPKGRRKHGALRDDDYNAN